MKYGNLMQMHTEFQEIKTNMPAVAYCLQSKMRQFYKENGIRVETCIKKIKDLNKLWRKCDEHGNPYMCEGQPVMLEGKEWKDYQRELAALMQQEVNIILH